MPAGHFSRPFVIMPAMWLARARFALSANAWSQLPADSAAEVAFAGRSNAGKSSAINTLTSHKLAHVSKTPGRTQLINFFHLDNERYLVDLPGYGYARVPEDVKRRWQGLLERYLQDREPLMGLVLIMDVRHPLTPLDRRLFDWFAGTGKPVHVLLSKADKLSQSQAVQALRGTGRKLAAAYPSCSVQLFSSLKRQGIAEAEGIISGWLGVEAREKVAAA
jgi:GTP-binding protein